MHLLEIIFGIVMSVMGLISLGYTLNAKRKFPEGSELKDITARLVVVISFLTCFSFWHVIREIFELKEKIGPVIEYPEYFFITIAFVTILITAKDIYKTAHKYGIAE
ncbi:MAG: hypothetical protein HZC48_13040 [Nitrospirae bacterium]|nr:hypothetical protein [Nitrospirota bacterium]